MTPILDQIRSELAEKADAETAAKLKRFFREEVAQYGVKSSDLHQIAVKYWDKLKELPKADLFFIFEEMLASGYNEEAMLVSAWAPKIKQHFEAEDLLVFERWIDRYLNNWAKIDTFCNHTVADLLERYPDSIGLIKRWSHSPNRWMRRASAVTLIIPAKRGEYLAEAMEIADTLMADSDDMVQKGYGWLLKEESRQRRQEIYEYILRNRHRMPRTALRYAIELMPQDMRAEAMRR